FAGMYVRDALTRVIQATALLAVLLAQWLSGEYVERTGLEAGEYYALMLVAALGAMLMAASSDLIMLFLGLETLSIPLYVFAAFLRVYVVALAAQAGEWSTLLAAISVLTMIVGNVAALRQTSIKRLLAYSSIAHAGFILTGVVAGTPSGASAVAFYLLAYTFMTLGAFAVVLM